MAFLAARGSGAISGVSLLHGRVSRCIFAPLFPRWPEDEVPVGHVTNGCTHRPGIPPRRTRLDQGLREGSAGSGTPASLGAAVKLVPDDRLWAMRTANRKALVDFANVRIGAQMASGGAGQDEIVRAQARLDPGILTLGFARRFATYKRPNLLLHDPGGCSGSSRIRRVRHSLSLRARPTPPTAPDRR